MVSTVYTSTITSTNYRGSTQFSNSKAILEANGIPVPGSTYLWKTPARNTATEADIQDAIDDGVIIISSAGNSYWNCDVSTGPDYNNSFTSYGQTYYHSRGSKS